MSPSRKTPPSIVNTWWFTAMASIPLVLTGCATSPAHMAAAPHLQDTDGRSPTPDIQGAQQASMLTWVRTLQSRNQHYAALAYLQEHDKRWSPTPESRLLQAQSLAATGQFAQAQSLYLVLIHQESLAGLAYQGLGLLAVQQGRMNDAITAFQYAAQLLPTNAAVLGDWGYALLSDGRLSEAQKPLKTAAELAPDDAHSLANLALLYYLTGQPELAEKVLNAPVIKADVKEKVRELAQTSTHIPATATQR